MTSTLDGYPVLVAQVTEPRIGRWTAYVEADSQDAITGQVTLSLEGVSFVGTVYSGAVESGRWIGRLVGGTNGLSTIVEPRAYRYCPLSVPLAELLSNTGETLSDDSDTLLSAFVGQWHRLHGSGALAAAAIATTAGLTWRVLRDGTLWYGTDAWAEVEEPGVEIHRIPALGIVETAPLTPTALPGATVMGVRATAVTTRLDAGSLRQEIWHALT